MKNKRRISRSVQEGVFFFLVGAALSAYALTSYGKAFNKDWGQSPYLFPLMVAVGFMALAVCLVREGMAEGKKKGEARNPASEETGKTNAAEYAGTKDHAADTAQAGRSKKAENWTGVAVVLALCVLYYAMLAYAKIPYITIGIFHFFFTFSTFEVATLLFLIAMMVYMGVRKPVVLALAPAGATLFLSIAFRTMLNVLLP